MPEYLAFLLMVVVFVALAMAVRLPIGLALAASAVAGMLASGQGLSLRHLVEGGFSFFDVILIIFTAMVYMKVLQASGILDSVTALLLRAFYGKKTLLLLAAMLLVMFPGMITGSSVTSVLSAGPLVAPVLQKLGMSRPKAEAFIAMGGILGMIAPPVNILVMIMGAGTDIPYVGFSLPLLLLTIPPAVFTAWWLGRREVKVISRGEMTAILPQSWYARYGLKLFLPLAVLAALFLGRGALARFMPDPGIPAFFLISSLAGLRTGRRFNVLHIIRESLREVLPLLVLLFGVGMFIQVMTLTGARGWMVVTILSLPSFLIYPGMALSLPVFGGVSAFGSASILGVPFILALIGKNAILTSTAMSAIASLGDLVPPTALAGIFAAQVVEEKQYMKVMRYCIVPALFILAMGLTVLLLATPLERILL
ncbi:MAG: TRAP transporter large permease subunit [Candidatus Aminicenantes bacterium]|nr:TRAP transporter large permease subunit [Candidatus Aminicenantes bacterium]